MEVEEAIYNILPPTKGVSAGGEWPRQEGIFEMPQEFSRKVCVAFLNKESEVARLKEGAAYTVSVNIESREYNGRWYTDVRAWRVQPKQEAAPAPAPTPEMPPLGDEPSYSAPASADVDDLPF